MYDELFSANRRRTDSFIKRVAANKSVDDCLFEATLEAEYRSPKLHLDQLGDKLRTAANAWDKVDGAMKIIDNACKDNPRGFPW